MDKSQRAALLREAFKAKVGKLAYVPSGKPLREPKYKPKGTCTGITPHGEMTPWHQVDWVRLDDAMPAPALEVRRTKRVSPLTRISQQLPRKLPRVTFPQ